MARAHDILTLAKHSLDNNRDQVINSLRAISANEPPNSSLRTTLERMLQRTPTAPAAIVPPDIAKLVRQENPVLPLDAIFLSGMVSSQVNDFLQERQHSEALQDAGLPLTHKLLLSGPPGNGKTTLAGAIAHELGLPLLVLDFASIITSYMGQTGEQIAKVFRSIQTPAVLFLDEIETVLSERGGEAHDVGEARRIVSTLLLEIDRLPDSIILVGATNHEELLDRAVVRRFDYQWKLPNPDQRQYLAWLAKFAHRYPDIPIEREMPRNFMSGQDSFSDIERDSLRWCRRWIIENSHPA